MVGIVVAPMIEARTERQLQPRCRGDDVLKEDAVTLLCAARHPLQLNQPGGLVETVLPTVAIDPMPVGAGRDIVPARYRLGPLRHQAGVFVRHRLEQAQTADAPRWRRG